MAFSYSDENFTVVGNLCFVHIVLDGKQKIYDIPPAISDRMVYDSYVCNYPYYSADNSGAIPDIGTAIIRIGKNGKIFCSEVGTGYLSFYFPIDSNK